MKRENTVIHIGTLVRAAAHKLDAPTSARAAFPQSQQKRIRTSRMLEQWISYETQARAIAIAAEQNWPLTNVTAVAIGLLRIILRSPVKHAALLQNLHNRTPDYEPTRNR